MKLWMKVFLCTFFLFEIVFNAASLYFIQYNFSQNLNREIERGLSEQHLIYSGLQSNSAYINHTLGFSQSVVHDFLRVTFKDYTNYFGNKGVYIELLDSSDNPVYTSFDKPFSGPRKELATLPAGRRNYIIRDIGDQAYLFVTSQLPQEDSAFKLTYIREISEVYAEKTRQINLFIRLNLITTVVLASGLYLLSQYLTRSIGTLTRSASVIAEGDYTQRATVATKDEVGILARSFNRMAAAVEEKVDELQKTVENKQHFIESFTHELKTPLTSIIGYADLLRSAKYDEELFFNSLNYLYSEGKRLESLSFKLMDLILLRPEHLALLPQNIREVCRKAEQAIQPQLERAGISLLSAVQPCRIPVEKDLFIVLCTNLIDNAIKASPEKGRIHLRGYLNAEQQFVLEVEDEGSGISEQDIANVFEPFFRVDKSRSRTHGGAGLGLAICSEIAVLHQARIEISSALGKGTLVTVTFPEFATSLQQKEDEAISGL